MPSADWWFLSLHGKGGAAIFVAPMFDSGDINAPAGEMASLASLLAKYSFKRKIQSQKKPGADQGVLSLQGKGEEVIFAASMNIAVLVRMIALL